MTNIQNIRGIQFEDLKSGVKGRVDKLFAEGRKTFSVRLDISPNAKTPKLVETFKKEVSRSFMQVHDKACFAVNSKVEIVLHSYATMFNLGDFDSNLRHFRIVLESLGMKTPGISIRHEQSKKDLFIEVEGSFKDVSPLDLYRTEAQLNDE